jgi:hypothetical protein
MLEDRPLRDPGLGARLPGLRAERERSAAR